ncbi:hypothetical protein ACF09J_17030 [Streptomyces sp. NPDC014889]|uniref:hypothetical protein n=1 Tax=Streptomyces sp. NPDC014889 TaxID=3364928 RepID=UPI0036F77AB8
MSSTLPGGQPARTLNTAMCPAGHYATGGGTYDVDTSTGNIKPTSGGAHPVGSPPTGFQSQLDSSTGADEETVVFVICRP